MQLESKIMNATKFQEQFQRIVNKVDGAARDNARTMIPRGQGPGDTWEGIDAIIASAESTVTDMLSERTTGYREWVLTQAQANRVLATVKARYAKRAATPNQDTRKRHRAKRDFFAGKKADEEFAAAKRLRQIMADRSGDDEWLNVPIVEIDDISSNRR